MCKYQSWFRVNQRWISAVQRWKSNVSELRKSALNSGDSAVSETALFGSETALNFSVLNSADSEKIRAYKLCKQNWSALMFIMFSKSALKNVKTMKQRCSALITSGTSTRDALIPEKFRPLFRPGWRHTFIKWLIKLFYCKIFTSQFQVVFWFPFS